MKNNTDLDKKILNMLPKSAVELAQDIMYDTQYECIRKERIRLAKAALSISPDCVDAYNLLAERNESSNWLCFLVEVRTFFEENPQIDF